MKTILTALAIAALASCTVTVGPDGRPIVAIDGAALADEINRHLAEEGKK